MKLLGIDHVSLNVHDAEESHRFYTEVLGLEVLERPDFPFPGSWLGCNNAAVHLIEQKGFVPPEGQHFAFAVEDIDGVLEELRKRGTNMKGRSGMLEAGKVYEIPGVGRQAFIFDPTGNLLELNESNK